MVHEVFALTHFGGSEQAFETLRFHQHFFQIVCDVSPKLCSCWSVWCPGCLLNYRLGAPYRPGKSLDRNFKKPKMTNEGLNTIESMMKTGRAPVNGTDKLF